MSIQKNHCFLNEQNADFFRRKLLLTVEDKDDCFEASDIDKSVEVTGDNNIFNAALIKSLIYFTSVQSAHILDTILQHAPYFMDDRPGIYAVMKYKTFQDLLQKETSPIMFIDDQGMRHWYYSKNPGGTYSHNNAYRMWIQENDATIKQMTVEYKISFEEIDEAALTIIEGPVLETDPNKIKTLLKGGMQCAEEVLNGMAFIMDGLNILEQVNVLIDLQNNDNKNGAMLSLAVSSLAVFNHPLTYLTNQIRVKMILNHAARKGKKYALKSVNKIATGQTSKIIGSAGIVLIAIEATFKAAQAGLNNDENAMAAFSVSAGFATAALVVSFIPGVNAAVWILMGVAACFSILGAVLTDDPMDLFLKYSFWGKEFHLAPRTIPNWWINGREGEESEEGFYLNDMTYEEKKIDYGKIDRETLDTYRLIDMERNLDIMKKAIQIPQNTVVLKDEAVLQYAVSPYVKLSLGSIDFEKLSFLKVKLLQSTEKRKMKRFLGILPILAPRVNADGMEELFSQTYHVDEIGDGLCHINSFTNMSRKVSDYHEANAFELLFITNFNELRRRHASSISERGSESWRYNNSLNQQEFKDHFNIHSLFIEKRKLKFDHNKIFEVTFSFRSEYNLMPVAYRLGVNRT